MAKGARERSTVFQFSKWRETGFLREFLVRGEDIGKNPVSEIAWWRETGFLPRYLIGGEDIGKNPVSEIVKAASL
jgi:hypothetical protein